MMLCEMLLIIGSNGARGGPKYVAEVLSVRYLVDAYGILYSDW